MTYDIFISYRRKGGYETAKHLYDLLTRDGYTVSFDIDTLRNGDFDTELLKRIDECTDFILILNERVFDRTVDPKFDPKKDWLRNELAYALKRGKNIIPVMLNGFTEFPDNLPDDVARVQKKNGPKYDQYYFDDFYRKLKEVFLETQPAEQAAPDATIRNLKVSSDAPCRLYVDETLHETLEAEKLYVFPLAEGTYKVTFVSTADEAVRLTKIVELEGHDHIDRAELLPLQRSRRENTRQHRLQQTAIALFDRYGGPIVWPDRPCERHYSYAQRGFLIAREGKFGVAAPDGDELIPCRYDKIVFSDELYLVVVGNRHGCIDRTGKCVVPCEYDELRPMGDNGLLPARKEGKWGYIDRTGKVVFDFTYEDALPFIYTVAAVRMHGLWGLIDERNDMAVNPVYDAVYEWGPAWSSEGLIPVRKNNKWGFIDKSGRYVLPPDYKQVDIPFTNGIAVVETQMKSCFIDRSGRQLAKIPQWSGDYYLYMTDGLLPLYKKNRMGCIDPEGKEVIPLEYDRVEDWRGIFAEGLLCMRRNGKWGYIDRQNRTVLDFRYDEAGDFVDGIARVTLNGTLGFIDREGNFLAAAKRTDGPTETPPAERIPQNDYERYILHEAELVRFVADDTLSLSLARIGYKDAKTGKVVIEPRYYYGPERIVADQKALVIDTSSAKLIDKLGDTIEEFHRIAPIASGFFLGIWLTYQPYGYVRYSRYKPAHFLLSKGPDKRIGVIDLHGRTVVPFRYDSVCLDQDLSLRTGELALTAGAVTGANRYDDTYEKAIDIWSLPLEQRIPKESSKLLKRIRRKNAVRTALSLAFLGLLYLWLLSPHNLFQSWDGLSALLKTGYIAAAAIGLIGAISLVKGDISRSDNSGILPIPTILTCSAVIYGLSTLSDLSTVCYWLRIGGYVVTGFVLLLFGVTAFFSDLKTLRRISK